MRVLFVDAAAAEFPALREHLAMHGDVVEAVAEQDLDAALASSTREADLVVIARDVWTTRDTDLCRRLRDAGHALSIVAVSGPCDARERSLALLAGADDFLSMPFEMEELAARALAVVRRTSVRPQRIRAGSFVVDALRHQVFVDDQPVAFTPREYDLFIVLLERIGHVVTRRELAARISRVGPESESNVVDVHMSRIRDKLGVHASQVETVRGEGYRLRLRQPGHQD